jgi:hypothetical protein
MTGKVVVSDIHAAMCVVLGKAEQHMPYGEVVGTTECITL